MKRTLEFAFRLLLVIVIIGHLINSGILERLFGKKLTPEFPRSHGLSAGVSG